jgi:hypothetical protein
MGKTVLMIAVAIICLVYHSCILATNTNVSPDWFIVTMIVLNIAAIILGLKILSK